MARGNQWPPLRPTLRRRVRQKGSDLLLQLGKYFHERDSDWLVRLQESYRSTERRNYHTETTPSADADLRLERIVYGDLYPVESFKELESGLSTLIGAYSAGFSPMENRKIRKWKEWIQNRKAKSSTGGWRNVGYLDLSSTCRFIDKTHVWANAVGDYVALSLVAIPSEKCRTRFSEIIQDGGEQSILLTFPNLTRSISDLPITNWIRFSPGHSEEPPSKDLRKQIDQLFLKCNKEIAEKLNPHTGGGLAAHGPLPSLEVISTALPESQSPTALWSREESLRDTVRETLNEQFWSCLGCAPGDHWSWNWGRLYRADRSDRYSFRSYQMLIHRPELVKYGDYSAGGDVRDGESASDRQIRGYFYFRGNKIGALLAIREQFFQFRQRLIRLRNQVSPQIGSEIGTVKQMWRVLWNGTSQLTEVNSIRFSQERLWSAVSEKLGRRLLSEGLRGAKRQHYDSDATTDFLEDWYDQLGNLREENQERQERIESSYEALFSITNAQVTILLQLTIVGLTFVLLYLTYVLVNNS